MDALNLIPPDYLSQYSYRSGSARILQRYRSIWETFDASTTCFDLVLVIVNRAAKEKEVETGVPTIATILSTIVPSRGTTAWRRLSVPAQGILVSLWVSASGSADSSGVFWSAGGLRRSGGGDLSRE